MNVPIYVRVDEIKHLNHIMWQMGYGDENVELLMIATHFQYFSIWYTLEDLGEHNMSLDNFFLITINIHGGN